MQLVAKCQDLRTLALCELCDRNTGPAGDDPLDLFLAEPQGPEGRRLVIVGVVVEHDGPVQPVHQLLGYLLLEGHVFKIFQKTAVKPVKIRLTLHQQAPTQVVKPGEAGPVKILFQPLHQGHPLGEGDL